MRVKILIFLKMLSISYCLENGLARTPPMGWLSWQRFRCNVDCKNDPEECISDQLFRTMANLVSSEGYADSGYQYIIVDDCWLEKERDNTGQLVADRQRFPYGMKNLSNYIHFKGLKFGIYENYGIKTCAGYPGILGHLENDANLFSSWNVDYIKIDGCNVNVTEMDKGFPEFGHYLNKTGRPMVYSCSWPYYKASHKIVTNYTAVAEHCNLWRYNDDIDDSYRAVEGILEHYANYQDYIIPFIGPGHWSDPDTLIIGNFGLSYEQSKSQMAMWAIIAAPLLMSVDLRTIRPEYKDILQNKKIIQVNQDPLGIPGRRIYNYNGIQCWTRPITPVHKEYYSYAIAFWSRRTDGNPQTVSIAIKFLGLHYSKGYIVEDLYTNEDFGILTPESPIKIKVNPTGVVMLRFNLNLKNNNCLKETWKNIFLL